MRTPTDRWRLDLPWWEMAGRVAVGVPYLLQGALMLAVNMVLAFDPVRMRSVLVVVSVTAILQVAAGALALRGRMALALFVAALGAALLLVFRLGVLPSPAATSPDSLPLEEGFSHLLLLWLVAWFVARRGRALPVLKGLSALLALAFIIVLPDQGRILGTMAAEAFLPRLPVTGYLPGDLLGTMTFQGPEGETLALDERGTIYVVDFWAMWCRPCVAELPHFLDLQRRFAGRPGVRFLAVNSEEAADWETVQEFLRRQRLTELHVAMDPTGVVDRVGVETIPAVLVVRDRRLLARMDGYTPDLPQALGGEIERALAASSAPGERRGQDLAGQP